MAEETINAVAGDQWSGGSLPFAMGSRKLGMWLFIASDSLTFSALLVGYSYVRIASEKWPTPFHFYPSVVFATLMTVFLLGSSWTMAMAVAASQRGDTPRVVRYILLTMAGGLGFVILHLNEWMGLIHEGVRLWTNPWGVPLFGATFFTLTGLHMFHVVSGIIYLGVTAIRVHGKRCTHEDVEISGLYWHFVDLVWMFILPLVYLLSVS